VGLAILVLVLTDLILFVLGRLAAAWHDHDRDVFGFWEMLVTVATVVIVAGAMLRIAHQLAPSPLLLMVAVVFYLPIVVQYGFLFSHVAANAGVEGLYSLKAYKRLGSDFSRARALANRNNIDGAAAQYRSYFDDDPHDAAPLFAAVSLLQQHQRFEEAAAVLREVMGSFQRDDQIWTRAAYELATLFRMHLDEPQTARYLYHQIIKRRPRSELGRLAHGHLAGTWEERALE
jgi:tetratricopeptide (TPR) repeat protein